MVIYGVAYSAMEVMCAGVGMFVLALCLAVHCVDSD